MTRISYILIIASTALLTASCALTTTLVTDRLPPVDTSTSEYINADWSHSVYCLSIPKHSTNPGVPKPKAVWVGYKRQYFPGTQPLPCGEWSTAIYRGAFRFDLSKYQGKKVSSAILHLTLGQADYVYNSGKVASGEGVWIKTIGLATSDWWHNPSPYIPLASENESPFPWKAIPGMPNLPYGAKPAVQKDFPVKYDGSYSYQITVTDVVRNWVSGKEPNMGFILIGTNEKVVAKSSDAALSPVTGISLDIVHPVPK